MTEPKKIVLLGATGSIGTSTLQVLRKHPDRLQLIGISANSNSQKLTEIVREFRVPYAYLPESAGFVEGIPAETTLDRSRDGLVHLASLAEADLVVVAIVGSSALARSFARKTSMSSQTRADDSVILILIRTHFDRDPVTHGG